MTTSSSSVPSSVSSSVVPSEPRWYVLQLFVEQDRFLAKYPTLPPAVREGVAELLYFRKPDKALYEREVGGIFVGYVFAAVPATQVATLHRALRTAGLGEVLGFSDGVATPLTDEEMERIIEAMRSTTDEGIRIGDRVRITVGPYEGFEGEVTNLAGHIVTVRVRLRRSVSSAEVSLENIERVA